MSQAPGCPRASWCRPWSAVGVWIGPGRLPEDRGVAGDLEPIYLLGRSLVALRYLTMFLDELGRLGLYLGSGGASGEGVEALGGSTRGVANLDARGRDVGEVELDSELHPTPHRYCPHLRGEVRVAFLDHVRE
jgi:hypothetical protein